MKVRVDWNHIRNGVRDSKGCPVALALKELGVEFNNITQQYVSFRVDDGRGLMMRVLPEEIQDWIWDYDNHNPVVPIEFTLEVPELVPA